MSSWIRSKFQKAESRLESYTKRKFQLDLVKQLVEAEHDVQQQQQQQRRRRRRSRHPQKPRLRERRRRKTPRCCKHSNGTLLVVIGIDLLTRCSPCPTLESHRCGCHQVARPTARKETGTIATTYGISANSIKNGRARQNGARGKIWMP